MGILNRNQISNNYKRHIPKCYFTTHLMTYEYKELDHFRVYISRLRLVCPIRLSDCKIHLTILLSSSKHPVYAYNMYFRIVNTTLLHYTNNYL